MDPISLGAAASAAQGGAAIFGGISAAKSAASVRQQEGINAEIGKIRADQTDAAARDSLSQELGAFRAALSANDAGTSVETLGLLNKVREARDRERRVGVTNQYQASDDARRRANASSPGMALAVGLAKSGPSLFDLYAGLK